MENFSLHRTYCGVLLLPISLNFCKNQSAITSRLIAGCKGPTVSTNYSRNFLSIFVTIEQTTSIALSNCWMNWLLLFEVWLNRLRFAVISFNLSDLEMLCGRVFSELHLLIAINVWTYYRFHVGESKAMSVSQWSISFNLKYKLNWMQSTWRSIIFPAKSLIIERWSYGSLFQWDKLIPFCHWNWNNAHRTKPIRMRIVVRYIYWFWCSLCG